MHQHRIIVALLLLMTLAAFWRATSCDFVNYDDNLYASANPYVQRGPAAEGINWAFTTGYAANYHPLTWLSLMLDSRLFGAGPHGYHLVNLLLHALGAVLLYLALHALTGAHWRSGLVAALWAVHPLRVESVVWISERKDVLSGCLAFATIWAYAAYARGTGINRERQGRVEEGSKVESGGFRVYPPPGRGTGRPPPQGGRRQRRIAAWGSGWGRYLLVVVLFALGLLAKSMLVTLPFVLLLLDVWPLRRIAGLTRLPAASIHAMQFPPRAPGVVVLEKIPLLMMSAAASFMTFYVQRGGGAVHDVGELGLGLRLQNMALAYVRYLGKMVWFRGLIVDYPYKSFPVWVAVAAAGLLLAITAGVLLCFRRNPWLVVGWFWYLGTLVPVIGLVQVGAQSMADRYTYLPSIGLLIMLVWSLPSRFFKAQTGGVALAGAAVVVLAIFSAFTWRQVGYWQDSVTLMSHALEFEPENYLPLEDLGLAYSYQRREPQEGVKYLEKAAKLQPNAAEAQRNLGVLLVELNRPQDALNHLQRAMELQPDRPPPYMSLGKAHAQLNQLDLALNDFRNATAADPSNIEAYYMTGKLLVQLGRPEEALAPLREMVRRRPEMALGKAYLGYALTRLNRFDEAIPYLQQAVQLDPRITLYRDILAQALAAKGDAAGPARRPSPDHAVICLHIRSSDNGGVRLCAKPRCSHLRAIQIRCGRPGPRLGAGMGYAVILVILFHRLFVGNVLSPGAIIGNLPPFHSNHYDATLNINLVQLDVWSLMEPWQLEQYQHKGGIPMWNPRVYCGYPIYSNGITEFLNPTHWIYYFVNPDLARGPLGAFQLWVSAMAVFILLSRWALGQTAAFLGGTIWMLSGFNIRWLLWPPLTDASLVMPFLVLALDVFLGQPSGRRWALAALAWLLMMLSGHPGIQLMAGIVVGIFVLVRLVALRVEGAAWSGLALRVLGCAGALVAAVAGAAAIILPMIQQVLGSFELAQGNRGTWPLPAKALWLFISPNIFGWPRGGHDYTGPYDYNEVCCWFGLVALALALTAAALWCWELRGYLGFRPRGVRGGQADWEQNSFAPRWVGGFALLLFVVSLPLAFGVSTLLAGLPFSAVGRATSFNRMFLGVQFAGPILASLGADLILRAGSRRAALLTCVLMIVGVVCGGWLMFHSDQIQYLHLAGRQTWAMFWLDSSVRVLGGLIIGALACVVLAAILWSTRLGQPVGNTLRIALVIAIVADLLWVAWDLNPIAPRGLVRPALPPTMRDIITMAGDGRIVASNLLLTPDLATIYGFRDPRGYDLPKSYRLGKTLLALGLRPDYLLLLPTERVAPVMDPLVAAWLDRCSVRFLVSLVNLPMLPIGALPTGQTATPRDQAKTSGLNARPWPLAVRLQGCSVYANPNAYSRAFMPVEAVSGAGAEALRALLDPATDLRQKTIYESTQPALTMSIPKTASGAVKITTDGDEEVVLDAQTPTGGLVVLGDRMDPGWSATVDGSAALPLIANYLFRGVQVPAGHHTIRWSYRPPWLVTGSVVSLVMLLFLCWLVFRGVVKRV